MPTMKPRFNRPVLAIKLKTELIAPVGDWIAIDLETEEIAHLTEAQLFMIYGRPDKTAKKNEIAPRRVSSKKILDEDRMLSAQGGRFFYILLAAGRPLSSIEVRDNALPVDKKSPTAALSVMKTAGLVEREGSSKFSKDGRWSPTERGLMIFQRLDLACFKKYNIEPPDLSHLADQTAKLALAE